MNDRTICMMEVSTELIRLKLLYYENIRRVGELMVQAFQYPTNGSANSDLLASLIGDSRQGASTLPTGMFGQCG